MFSHAIAVFSVPMQEKINVNFNSPGLYVIYECNVMFFLQFGALWKEVEYAIIINHVPIEWLSFLNFLIFAFHKKIL